MNQYNFERRSLEDLDNVIEEILQNAPPKWFETLNKIISDCKNNNAQEN